MTSRLDRIFVLLESGSAPARSAAARQLGEVQKARPDELHRLLDRLMRYLRSPAWDTRIAAAQAVGAILKHVPEWEPPPPGDVKIEEDPDQPERLSFATFDLENVLENGAHLMACSAAEFDMDEEALTAAEQRERLARQRQQLNSRLGLDVAINLGVDIGSVYTNEDLCIKKEIKQEEERMPVEELVSTKALSSREINLAKRKARQGAFCKQKSRDCSEQSTSAPSTPDAEPDRKRFKPDPEETTVGVPPAHVWPLAWWCRSVVGRALAAHWECRHGAAAALRELLRSPAVCAAGRKYGQTQQQREEAHQEWLEDICLRLICVLALDRFGDFVSDQVVAPVRETSAQTLGVALSRADARVVCGVARLLAALAERPQWEARHGALLGLKYLLLARPDMAGSCGAISLLVAGVSDRAEDVSAVACAALAPAAAAAALLVHHAHTVPQIVTRLWNLLEEQDELAAPANSYMALLASLMSLPEAAKMLYPIDLPDVLPRLWSYLQHCSSSVRKATMQTLLTVTKPHEQDKERVVNWTPELLQQAMRFVYQRILFEHIPEIQDVAMQVWRNLLEFSNVSTLLLAACPMLSVWACTAMLPARAPADSSLLLESRQPRNRNGISSEAPPPECVVRPKQYLGGGEGGAPARDHNATKARVRAAQCLGLLSCYLVQPAPGIEYKKEDESPIDCYVRVMIVYLRSSSALQRLVSSLVISQWALHTKLTGMAPPPRVASTNGVATASTNGEAAATANQQAGIAPESLTQCLHAALTQPLYYDEVALNCNRILQEARDLHAMMKHYKLPVDAEEFNNILRLEQVVQLATISEPMLSSLKSKRVATTLEERRKSLLSCAQQCNVEQAAYHVSVQAALAGACVNLNSLPEKLNPVIRPLMESIKRESCPELQKDSAKNLAAALAQLADRQQSPNDKVLANLKHFLRCDPEVTPRVNLSLSLEDNGEGGESPEGRESVDSRPHLDPKLGILTLWEQQRAAEKVTPRRGRPPAVVDVNLEQMLANQDEKQKQLQIQRRGATFAFLSIVEHFGENLPEKLPKLWEFISEPFTKHMTDEELENQDVQATEELISRLQVVECVLGHVPGVVVGRLRWECAVRVCRHWSVAARHMAARALAAHPQTHLPLVQLVTWLGDMRSDHVRCGAAEALARIADAARVNIVPYGALLVLPLLGRMSDPCEPVRVMSTRCFATLIQLMPLDGAVPEPPGLTPELRAKRDRDKQFLERLFHPKSIEDYQIPVPVNAQLRSYQQAGVNWLRFLNEYKLHGVLCDDMGLGKTLQCICVVAGSHYERQKKFEETGADDCAPLPSLVVCPPTLTGHWVFEVNKFLPTNYLNPLQYVGPPAERERLRLQVSKHNLIVASYDIVRKDIDFFSSLKWNYCILDEGHVIKNGKTKVFKAIKQLIANHRLILSGTPIQNNVLELWSLFDFLMPGLLGSERQFTARYSRPILAARDSKPSAAQQQASALACITLHRQVLPFLLRRVKEDVLRELPPKITQDYFCELSPLQKQLYEDFSRQHLPDVASPHQHVFQALHYLQDVCNHPKLVLTSRHPAAARVAQQLAAQLSTLDDIHHAAKLPALRQLLLDCGIGTTPSDPESASVVSQHRALIFCQQKKMLDIVEKDLLKKHLPDVTYLRLDGSVPAVARHDIVTTFNNDVSIDVLLLTTKVGGLGLNLTGADTVIFVEHDWNPTRDLQAMDRAHRIGQKRVVNVYRLITRGTLEERIMGLQKFKIQTANSVISQENASIETMGTESLLDLVQPQNQDGGGGSGLGKSVLDSLPELWDDRQYEEEYDISAFINSLNKKE